MIGSCAIALQSLTEETKMTDVCQNDRRIAETLKLPIAGVRATLQLLAEDATVPFIARYRKEATGTLDEVAITDIRDLNLSLIELDKRRLSIIGSLKERELLTDELSKRLQAATAMNELEDIYLPFRPKRKTRASVAKEKGLEPLAEMIFNRKTEKPRIEAERFISEEKGVATVDEALAGASDIMAERIAEDEHARRQMRKLWENRAEIISVVAKGKETEGEKFKDYFDWVELARSAPSHRILAILRGESEKMLRVSIEPEEKEALEILERQFAFGKQHPCLEYILLAVKDSFKRLLAPSMESELRTVLKQRADLEAIEVFASNLRELLLSPPLGESRIMAVDPGFRTGCKVVCLSPSGELLHNDVFYLHKPDSERGRILDLAKRFNIETITIGNGTASRETEEYLRTIDFSKAGLKPTIFMVNESGASIYSASEVAREEFPDHDITVRGAVSIGRRTQDPLAELVKIDPKSIGVGQYQHDVCQKSLQKSLDDTVISCVNSVGVELNTASKELLSYVSGLGKQLASNIVKHRQEVGTFKSRSELKKVPRLGAKAFEQCAGFLRIRGGAHPLDASAVHPERYELVEKMAKDVGTTVAELIQKPEMRKKIDAKKYLDQAAGLGLPTLEDILVELAKPGRDPRAKLEPMRFADGINKIDDLRDGMRLPGIVTNVTAFGAFVDVGVHQDGLVHVSELADRFVKDPKEVVKVNQRVLVTVLSVDQARKRIALSLKR